MTGSEVKYRSRTDIVASILQSAAREGGGIGVTRLMYNSFLSYNQVSQYVKIIKENGLLNYDASTGKYTISAKGSKYLELHSKMDKMLHGDRNNE
jgi:predicted transcriptional regulator